MTIRNIVMSSLIAFICASIPLQSMAGIFFQDDFESGDLGHSQNGAFWDDTTGVAVNRANPKTGNYSMEFFFPGAGNGADGWAEQRFRLGGKYPDIWVSYDILIPSNYYHRYQSTINQGTDNNKGFLHLWEGSYNSPDGPSLGLNNWPLSDGSSRASVFVFSPPYFDNHENACPQVIKMSDRGQWINITVHAKYASSSNSNDGVYQLWKTYSNGTIELACDITRGYWYVPGQGGFDTGYLLGWANSGFTNDTKFYIDNVKFSDTPLLANIQAPPDPPSAIQ